jgi:hypothetical protein
MEIVPCLESKGLLMRRKVRITISRTKHLKSGDLSKLLAYCPVCEKEEEVVSRAQASDFLQTAHLEQFGNRIHIIEMVNGIEWVCKKSLFKSFSNEKSLGSKYDKV